MTREHEPPLNAHGYHEPLSPLNSPLWTEARQSKLTSLLAWHQMLHRKSRAVIRPRYSADVCSRDYLTLGNLILPSRSCSWHLDRARLAWLGELVGLFWFGGENDCQATTPDIIRSHLTFSYLSLLHRNLQRSSEIIFQVSTEMLRACEGSRCGFWVTSFYFGVSILYDNLFAHTVVIIFHHGVID